MAVDVLTFGFDVTLDVEAITVTGADQRYRERFAAVGARIRCAATDPFVVAVFDRGLPGAAPTADESGKRTPGFAHADPRPKQHGAGDAERRQRPRERPGTRL